MTPAPAGSCAGSELSRQAPDHTARPSGRCRFPLLRPALPLPQRGEETGRSAVRPKRPARASSRARVVTLRIVSWNINSIRVRLDNLARLTEELRPDVICLQETKVEDRHFPAADVADLGYPHLLTRGMKGYNGVAILSRLPLEPAEARVWCGRDEGRYVAARISLGSVGALRLDNFYVPSGGDVPDPARNPKFAYKLRFFDEMIAWVAGLKERGRRAILMGDLNVAPLETDVWNHKRLLEVVTHTPAEIERMERLMAANDWRDAVRHFVPPSERLYSWWSYRARDWSKSDRGRRLDHIWVTPALAPALEHAVILRSARGWERASDHAPVCVTLRLAS